ncbi:hypothetical protein BTN50_1476 [Candidatus Enterovibrio altilux]|uniref:Uncharacterized protein n=1 Tax=Candidatus Enterovibrio altilux TaxID=1927128 RepID=A0A291BAB9_9GAMM|nr:hypothetical protein BTN50_1476 [Candidatus Enterovibrio luxaltus]
MVLRVNGNVSQQHRLQNTDNQDGMLVYARTFFNIEMI